MSLILLHDLLSEPRRLFWATIAAPRRSTPQGAAGEGYDWLRLRHQAHSLIKKAAARRSLQLQQTATVSHFTHLEFGHLKKSFQRFNGLQLLKVLINPLPPSPPNSMMAASRFGTLEYY
jgi:hypothetical protein